jgi:hypothetical protein
MPASHPLSVLFSESLAGRFARFEPDRVLASRFTGPSAEDFLHKSLGMLNAWLRGVLQARAGRAVALPAAILEKTEQRKNPCAIGISARSKKYRAHRCAVAPCTLSCVLPARFETQDVVSLHARWRFIVQKRWFFYRAVVMPMQCARSPRALDDIATHSWLGGQHGEEAKEDGEGSEKGREEDQAPEEEVSARRASVFDFERRR